MADDKVGVSPKARADDIVGALCALRDRLAAEIDFCDQPQVLAVLSREFRAVSAEISAAKPVSPGRVDEIAEKYAAKLRAVRGAGTADTKRPARKAKSG